MTPELAAIVDKLNTLSARTNGIVLECTTEVRCGINALLTGRHVCMIGPPGVAKSLLVRTLVGLIDGMGQGSYFETLLGKMDTPGKLLGPISLKALEQDEERRNTIGRLPEAKVAFIDEIWEGSSALLEYLLPILNERLFHNAGLPTRVPLVTAFMASNKTPERSAELAALWDRITFRLFTKPLQNDDSFGAMLRAAYERFARNGFAGQEVLEPVITWDEIVTAQEAVRGVVISDDVFEALTTLRGTLSRDGIVPSERRFAHSLPVIQAQAFLAGRMVAGIDDMRLLAHVLWNTQDQQPTVQRQVFELANPDDKVAMEISESVEVLAKELDALLTTADNTQARSRKAVELQGKLENASDDVKKLRSKMRREGRTSDLIDPLRQRVLSLSATLLKECFTLPVDDDDDDE
jgi:MoxR-like ATPase